MLELDYSLPLADLLRIGTAKAHQDAENSEGGIALASGKLDKEEYVRFLMMMFHIYSIFEQALDQHSSHPTLHPTYNPAVLARTSSLESDISFLLQVPESSWQSHPLHTAVISSPPPQFTQYISRLEALSASPDPSPLLAHAYVRYLGDLSGGQFIRRRISKAYELDNTDGDGVRFYVFKQLGGTKEGNIGDFKKIKEWYRDGMNVGAGDNQELKATIVEEANIAFELNYGIFCTLKVPPIGNVPSESTPPLVGDALEEEVNLTEAVTFKEIPVGTEQAAERLYSVSTVTSVIVAICVAHFLLVVGGFTGAKGYAKLAAIEAWFGELVGRGFD